MSETTWGTAEELLFIDGLGAWDQHAHLRELAQTRRRRKVLLAAYMRLLQDRAAVPFDRQVALDHVAASLSRIDQWP